MVEGHSDVLENSFSSQAAAFEDERVDRVFASDVDWLFERLVLRPEHLVLDVAGGTGHAARCLAPSVGMVVVLDVTVAMLAAGKIAAEQRVLRKVVFMRGDAAAVPFLDASFDVVVCRFAVHHFERPGEQLAEMVRCVRPGGQLVVADLVADDDRGIARAQNRLERLRDRSHATLLSSGELRDALEDLGVAVTDVAWREVQRPLAPWLAQTDVDTAVGDEITSVLRSEIAGGRPSGLRPSDHDGELWFTQRFASVTASKRT